MNPRIRNKSWKFKNLSDVELFANRLLETNWKFGGKSVTLKDEGYEFVWDNRSSKRLGYCNYTYRQIGVALKIIELNLPKSKEIRDVILHEIAHGITYEIFMEHRHTKNWKKVLLSIGGNGLVRYDARTLKLPELKYTLICENCGLKLPITKPPKYRQACGVCCVKGFDAKYIMKVVNNY